MNKKKVDIFLFLFFLLTSDELQMRIPSDQFDTVAVSEVSYEEKLEQQQQQQQHRTSQQPSPAASLFSGFQLKLPQFRIRSPNNTSGEGESGNSSVPSSPTFSRHGSERRKDTLAPTQRFLHPSLSRHQSLSTNNTPSR